MWILIAFLVGLGFIFMTFLVGILFVILKKPAEMGSESLLFGENSKNPWDEYYDCDSKGDIIALDCDSKGDIIIKQIDISQCSQSEAERILNQCKRRYKC